MKVFKLFVLINVVNVVVLIIKMVVVWILEIINGNVICNLNLNSFFFLFILNVFVVFFNEGLIFVKLV